MIDLTEREETVSVIDRDAREFGLHVKQGGWRLGLLVARSVRPGEQGKGKSRVSADDSALNRVTCRQFATLAGISDKTVKRYFDAWELAANDGLVPYSDELITGDEFGFGFEAEDDDAPPWSKYYSAAKPKVTPAPTPEPAPEPRPQPAPRPAPQPNPGNRVEPPEPVVDPGGCPIAPKTVDELERIILPLNELLGWARQQFTADVVTDVLKSDSREDKLTKTDLLEFLRESAASLTRWADEIETGVPD